MNLKKTAALAAVAALAAPAAADAAKPTDPGSKGQQKSQNAKSKQKGVGFAVAGVNVGVGENSFADSTSAQDVKALTLDVTSANKHARTFLSLTTDESKKGVSISDTADGKAIVRFVGFEGTPVLDAFDRVKVVGKVTRVRKGASAASVRKLDIRKITITNGDAPATEATS